MIVPFALCVVGWLAASPAAVVSAPPRGAVTEAAAKDARISVEVVDLDVEVHTWAQAKIEVSTDVPGFVPVISGPRRRLRVALDGVGLPANGKIVLRVPQHAELRIDTVKGDVTVHGLRGEAEIGTVSGDIAVDGAADRLELAVVEGDVRVTGAPKRVDVTTVNGSIAITGAREEIEAESISGGITLHDVVLGRMELTTVAGAIAVAGTLHDGPLRIDSHAGPIDVAVPVAGPLGLVIDAFSGDIVDRFDATEVRVRGSHRRSLGRGGGTLRVNSFSGDVTIGPPRATK